MHLFVFFVFGILYSCVRRCTFCMAPCSLLLARLYRASCYPSPWQRAKPYPTTNCCASPVFSTGGKWWYLYAENLRIPGPKQYPNTKFLETQEICFFCVGRVDCWCHLMRQHLIRIESNSFLIIIIVIIMVMTRWPKETRKKKGEMAAVYLEERWLPGTMGSAQLGAQ